MSLVSKLFINNESLVSVITATGDPTTGFNASRSSLYLRSDGGASSTLYIKTGSGITDWSPVQAGGSTSVAWADVTGKPSGLVSSSAQVTYGGLSGIPSGIVSASSQFTGQALSWTNTQTYTTEARFIAGGQSLRLSAQDFNHTYLAFYPYTATPNARQGYIGYASPGSADLTVMNENSGSLNLGQDGVTRAKIDGTGITLSANRVNQANGNPIIIMSTNYTGIYDPNNVEILTIGGVSDPSVYYNNTNHYFRNRAASAFFATINSNGVSVTANRYNNSAGQAMLSQPDGVYTRLTDQSGNPALQLGGTTDPTNYYDNTTHSFRNRSASTVLATVNASGITAPNFIKASDRRLKSNVVRLSNAVEHIQQLNGYSYTMIPTGQMELGVMADEVEAIVPSAVFTTSDGFKSVAYDRLIPLLVEAVKELKSELEEIRYAHTRLQ